MYQGIIRQYSTYLPVEERAIVSLSEGRTPLLPAPRLAEALCPGMEVFFKLEGLNPTGSFKDRGMTYAVSKALEGGSKAVICASTGNTSAAAAAYAARAGMKAVVLIPEGKIALGKLSQAMVHGAQVFQVRGNFDDALRVVREIAQKGEVTWVNSVNPHRLMGQRSAAYEIVEALGDAPTHHALPVGNGGNITAYWAGYQDYLRDKKSRRLPKMLGFQAEGSAPLVLGHPVTHPETLATAIRIGNPASWKGAISARDDSGGLIDSVTDDEILSAYRWVAGNEGYFCEPASAASIAGVFKLSKKDFFKKGDLLVCTLTGHGLKDPENAIKISPKPQVIDADADELGRMLKSGT